MATAGLVAGPVAGPISSIQHDGSCTEAWFSIPFGMYMGFCRGLEKDLDFLTHASYFAPGTMRMALVFDAFAGIKGGPETLYQPAGPANGAADPKARIPTQDVERSAR